MIVHNNLIIVETLHPEKNIIAKLDVLTKNMSKEEERASAVKTFNDHVERSESLISVGLPNSPSASFSKSVSPHFPIWESLF